MHNQFRINPIMKKEMVVGSRSMRMSWAIMGINAFLTIVVLLVLSVTNLSASTSGYDYSALVWLFPILGGTECILISLIVPIITSVSISGERERQTLDIMLTTPVSPFSIALGKLGAALAVVMLYMLASVPIMAIAFVLGGLNWWALLGLFALQLYLGIYVGSIGEFCSSVVKKSVISTILAIAIGFGIVVITTIILYVSMQVQLSVCSTKGLEYSGPGAYVFVMFLNPYSPILDFMLRVTSDCGICDWLEDAGTKSGFVLFVSRWWIACSVFINLLISYVFLKLSARNLSVQQKCG